MHRTTLIAAALLAPLAAAAQTAPAPPPAKQDAPLVVTAVRTTDDEIADFVDAVTIAPPRGQLARFAFAVCPVATGVDAAQRDLFADRIRAVARAAGVPVAKPKCDPNIVVIVTPDKKALIEGLIRRRPAYLGNLSFKQARALAASPDPAAAWHIGGTVGADGETLDQDPDGFSVNRTVAPGSHISLPTHPIFAVAIVVLDSHALDGLTINQVADYAAMRTLIETDPSRLGSSPAPTILKVLTTPMGSPVPLSLTAWDLGVLRGFYAADPNLTAAAQRPAIRKGVKTQVGGN